jgi:(2R)-sulfolactate sulfo-lyase subunit alpha
MIHAVLHEAKDTVGVAVVEGITAGTNLNAWIMDEDEIVTVLYGHRPVCQVDLM